MHQYRWISDVSLAIKRYAIGSAKDSVLSPRLSEREIFILIHMKCK